MRVFVRLRPPGKGDGEPMVRTDAARRLIWLGADRDGSGAGGAAPADPVQFEVDRVLTPAEDQAAVYAEVAQPVVEAVSHGATGCIMCYGQTGAGKSFTLANESAGQEGVMIQAFKHIFERAAETRELKYDVAISYQQIYLDTITDLLSPNTPVEIREDPKTVRAQATTARSDNHESSSNGRTLLASRSTRETVA